MDDLMVYLTTLFTVMVFIFFLLARCGLNQFLLFIVIQMGQCPQQP